MAQLPTDMDVERDSHIVINLGNYEERHIYNSICDYVNSVIKNTAGAVTSAMSNTPKKIKLDPKMMTVYQLTPGNRLTREGKVILDSFTPETPVESRIKRIPSNSLVQFLKSESEKEISPTIIPKNILQVNEELILTLQNLSETGNGDTFRPNIQTPAIVPVNIPLHIISEMKETELECINYTGRKLVVLNIPDDSGDSQIIFNRNGTWVSNGCIGPAYPRSKICPFYLSTGKSNDTNFPGMWFPFFRIKTLPAKHSLSKMEKGWIYKAWGLQSVKKLRERLNTRFNIPLPTEGKETQDMLYCLLEKFSHWWQIQLSLQLPIEHSTLWETNDLLKEFKKIVLNYDYDNFLGDNNCFIPIKQEDKKIYILKQCEVVVSNDEPEEINKWLRTRTPRVVNILPIDSESRETPATQSQSSQSSE